MKFFKRKEKKDKKGWLKVIKTILIVLIIVLAVYGILWKIGVIDTLKIAKQVQEQKAVSAEDQKILNQLKKIIDLPEDLMPIMAVINDVELLRKQNQRFFAKAKNGDRLIIYPDKAIIYDALEKKIMNIGPVNFGQAAIGTVPFALHNGTGDEAKMAEFEKKLTSIFNNAVVKVRNNASGEYDQTLVIDLKGDNPEIQKIADSLGGVVSELPAGEIAPQDVAVLIIIGKDQ